MLGLAHFFGHCDEMRRESNPQTRYKFIGSEWLFLLRVLWFLAKTAKLRSNETNRAKIFFAPVNA